MTTALPINASPCQSLDPGHGISPEHLSNARSAAGAWGVALVSWESATEPIRIRTTAGTGHYMTHDPLPLLELLGVTGGLPGKVTWNPEAGILGIVDNPRIRAGYRYFSLAVGALDSCTLDHDPALANEFDSVMGTFDLPCYERNTGSSA